MPPTFSRDAHLAKSREISGNLAKSRYVVDFSPLFIKAAAFVPSDHADDHAGTRRNLRIPDGLLHL
jgi:hypothetical protein